MLKFNKILLLTAVLFAFLTPVSGQNQTAQDFFNQGLGFLRAQKPAEALEAFRKSAQLDAKQPATHANIGVVLLALKRVPESIASFREAIRLAPNEPNFRAGLCRSLSVSEKHAEALEQCEEAVRLGGASPEPYIALIAALRAASREAEAAQKAETALQKFAEDEMLLNASADAFADTENFSRALEIYEKLASLKPKNAYYQVKLAENYLRFERDADALAAARKALETEPKHHLAYYYIGKIYFELGQHEESAGAFQKSAEINPQFSEAFYFLGQSEARRDKYEKAITAFRQALAIEAQNFEYHNELGSALSKASRYEESAMAMRKAVALKPKDFQANVGLGGALSESGQYEEAIKYLMIADQLKPGNQIVNMFLNVARTRQQMAPRIGEMIAYAKENPQDINVRMHLIQNLTFGRRLEEAEPYFAEIWKLNPPDSRVYDIIGTLRSTTGNYEKAAEAYRKSLEFGQSPAAYLGLANVYAKNGQIEEAMKAYEKVFEIKPDTPNIMKLYADFLRDNGRRREALEMYKRSLAQLPTNAPAIFNAGVLSAKLGDLAAARQYLETLKTVDPQLAKILARCLKLGW
jgi:tetratricopeptide (TPR) repeat protein